MSSEVTKLKANPIGVCTLSICPMRKRPDETSEMVSQLLFGEQCDILNTSVANWSLICSRIDGYEGWVDVQQIDECKKPHNHKADHISYCLEPGYSVMAGEQTKLITFGAILPHFDGMSFELNGSKYGFWGQAARPGDFNLTEALVEKLCKKFLNAPYLWGGKTPFGVDCSGFVQMVFRVLGAHLPRDAKDQAKEGLTINFVNESMTGDLAFFTKSTNRISHVGVILENEQIIHASGKVRVDKLDHVGIFNREAGKYTHHLRIIKRVL